MSLVKQRMETRNIFTRRAEISVKPSVRHSQVVDLSHFLSILNLLLVGLTVSTFSVFDEHSRIEGACMGLTDVHFECD